MTYEQLMAESRRLAAAGQVDDARRVAQIALSVLRSTNPNPAPGASGQADPQAIAEMRQGLGAQIGGFAEGARNMVGLGFTDELDAGVIGGLLGGLPREDGIGVSLGNYGTPMGERYTQVRDAERARLDAAREAAPGATMAGEVIGGMVPAMAGAPATVGTSILNTMGRGALVGGVEGALMGAGTADGQPLVPSTLQGAGLGAVLGGAAPAVVAALRGVADPIGGMASRAIGRGSPTRAGRVLARGMERARQTPDDVGQAVRAAYAENQPFTMADALGSPGQRMLAGVARSPGEGEAEIRAFLESRQGNQGDRMAGFLREALDVTPETAAAREAAMVAERGARADVNFGRARETAQPVDVRPVLDLIDERLGPMTAQSIDLGAEDRLLQQFRDRLSVPAERLPEGSNQIDLSDFSSVLEVKRDIADAISVAQRAGQNNRVRLLTGLRQRIDQALEAASPPVRQANAEFAAESRAIDALGAGADATRRMRVEDALQAYRSQPQPTPLSVIPNANALPGGGQVPQADPRGAFRTGFADEMLNRIENIPPGHNTLPPFTTDKNAAIISEMAQDPDMWNRRLARELTMAETRQAALGGSPTSQRLADMRDVDNGGAGEAIMQAVTSPRSAIIRQIAGGLGNVVSGSDEQTRTLIARALLSPDPQAALQPLLRRAQISAQQQRAAEALMRQLGQQGVQ